MFSQMKGKVIEKAGNKITMNIEGTGFFFDFIYASSSSLSETCVGDVITAHIYSVQKDNNGTINSLSFGFYSEKEKEFFIDMTSIKGIGEKTAIAILSFYSPAELLVIIQNKDKKKLSQVPKIGLKTAEKFLLDLDKLITDEYREALTGNIDTKDLESVVSVAESALVNLGIKDSRKSLEKIIKDNQDLDSSLLVKEYFKQIKKPA